MSGKSCGCKNISIQFCRHKFPHAHEQEIAHLNTLMAAAHHCLQCLRAMILQYCHAGSKSGGPRLPSNLFSSDTHCTWTLQRPRKMLNCITQHINMAAATLILAPWRCAYLALADTQDTDVTTGHCAHISELGQNQTCMAVLWDLPITLQPREICDAVAAPRSGLGVLLLFAVLSASILVLGAGDRSLALHIPDLGIWIQTFKSNVHRNI